MLRNIRCKNISVLNFVPQGRGRDNKEELMLSKEELKEFSEILKKKKNIIVAILG